MGKKLKIKWNSKGFEKILTCEKTKALCDNEAAIIRDRANVNYVASVAKRVADGDTSDIKLDDIVSGENGYEAKPARTVHAYGSLRAMSMVSGTDKMSRIAEAEDKALSRAVH